MRATKPRIPANTQHDHQPLQQSWLLKARGLVSWTRRRIPIRPEYAVSSESVALKGFPQGALNWFIVDYSRLKLCMAHALRLCSCTWTPCSASLYWPSKTRACMTLCFCGEVLNFSSSYPQVLHPKPESQTLFRLMFFLGCWPTQDNLLIVYLSDNGGGVNLHETMLLWNMARQRMKHGSPVSTKENGNNYPLKSGKYTDWEGH